MEATIYFRKRCFRTFKGLTGQVQFSADRNLIHPACDVLNIVGTSPKRIGFWSNYSGLSVVAPETLCGKALNATTSSQQLHNVTWPGETRTRPCGWAFLSNGKPLRIGVPY